jgi:hypothetical protein
MKAKLRALAALRYAKRASRREGVFLWTTDNEFLGLLLAVLLLGFALGGVVFHIRRAPPEPERDRSTDLQNAALILRAVADSFEAMVKTNR